MSTAVSFDLRLNRAVRRAVPLKSLLVLGFWLLAVVSHAKGGFQEPFVLTQVPRQGKTPPAGWNRTDLVRCDWFEGARVVLVGSEGQIRVLSEGLNSACDPSVSFDGQHILFAGRKDHNARWRIWEIGADGQGLRPVTPEDMDARSPIYATTLFTLDSPEPWFTTVFVGRDSSVNEAGRCAASSLYNIRLDGTDLRRLTFNPNHNFDPFQTWDGRVIYSAERYPNQPGGKGGRIGLYAIHVEGADMELYGGELGQRVQQMACVTPGGLVIFVESNHGAWDGAGQLACLEERRPHVTYRQLTKESAHLYLYPSALRENAILVSRRSAKRNGQCGVFCFNVDHGSCELVFDSPDYHDVQAVALQPRIRPDGHSTVVDTKLNTGIFYGMNCYDADQVMALIFRPVWSSVCVSWKVFPNRTRPNPMPRRRQADLCRGGWLEKPRSRRTVPSMSKSLPIFPCSSRRLMRRVWPSRTAVGFGSSRRKSADASAVMKTRSARRKTSMCWRCDGPRTGWCSLPTQRRLFPSGKISCRYYKSIVRHLNAMVGRRLRFVCR